MPNQPASPEPKPRSGSTVIAAGLLLSALALVVLYTSKQAFRSPLALVVVAAIGVAALLLQMRIRPALARDRASSYPVALWFSGFGVVCAAAAMIGGLVHLGAALQLIAALAGVVAFAAGGIVILKELRSRRSK